ncbi:stromal cell-derived factor 1 isoform X1 [Tachyglossus aculeatus]|uniref:stromal cell-derived factor 1 isoform X1 n=1 Tax=Tachyglossus aculeatus TaxID=9261 RepID=UPI0018F65916|nr:stromal cell-derived factor 1 isoform X1 [Tachyglossus aculeatus]
MDLKGLALLTLLLVTLSLSEGKPISLSYRCPCRFSESNVAKANIKQLKILNTPNCALQIVARLKNSRQVCIDPKLKWIQEYLEKALNKRFKM